MPTGKVKKTAAKATVKATPKKKAVTLASPATGLTELADKKLCLSRLSKDIPDGAVLVRTSLVRSCTGACLTITRAFTMRARIVNNRCDDPSPIVAGLGTTSQPRDFSASLKSVSLGAGSNASQREKQRGFHVGTFRWQGAVSSVAFVVEGTMSGMTNVGTVRGGGNPFSHAPASCKCEQKCDADGFLEGQLFGAFAVSGKSFRLTASYRINYDPAVNEHDPQSKIHAAIEGVVIAPCPTQ